MSEKILIAGGGTGGHIYPAVAIAQGLKKKSPDTVVEFVGTAQGLETKIIPREGFKLHLISAAALNNVGLVVKLFSLFILPWGILQSVLLILKEKPKVVLGVGGYASGPMMIAAVLLRRRTAVFEPNAYPGLTNRWLAPFVDMAFVNFAVTASFFKKAEVLGMPVREGMERKALGGGSAGAGERLRVLIFGGSQGARGINEVVVQSFRENPKWNEEFEIVHQIGATDWKKYSDEYEKLKPSHIQWFEFLYDMPERYAWADLVLCRAGAATLSELASCKKAAILVPFPFAADNHQFKNAEALSSKGAAVVIVQKDFTVAKFKEILTEYKNSPAKRAALEDKIQEFHKSGAAGEIASRL